MSKIQIKKIVTEWLRIELDGNNIETSFEELFLHYLNLKNKILQTKPRKIYISKELDKKKVPLPFLKYFNELKEKIRKGDDISYALSKASKNSESLDYLLVDWGIHHLHLIDFNQPENRSDYLLFGIFPKNDAILIDIARHDKENVFSNIKYLEIIYRNWPVLLKPFEIKSVNSNYQEAVLSKSRTKYRKLGINFLFQIDNKIFFPPGGGFNGGPSNSNDMFSLMEYTDYLGNIQHQLESDIKLRNILSACSFKTNSDCRITEIFPYLIIHSKKNDIVYHFKP